MRETTVFGMFSCNFPEPRLPQSLKAMSDTSPTPTGFRIWVGCRRKHYLIANYISESLDHFVMSCF